MEHTIKIEKELKITTQDITDYVLCCEAGGFDYWGELCSADEDYEAARKRSPSLTSSLAMRTCWLRFWRAAAS